MKWNKEKLTIKEAMSIQQELASKVRFIPYEGVPSLVGGVDLSYSKKTGKFFAGLVIIAKGEEGFKVIEEVGFTGTPDFPYVPGLLSFREGPAVLELVRRVKNRPDVLFCDGQGIAHPRFLGIAAHIGVLLEMPSIGVAKSRLVGKYEEPGNEKGNFAPLMYHRKQVGVVLRTKRNTKPVFVSPGNLITIADAMRLTLDFTGRYRIPEPTRLAHLFVNRLRVEQNP